MVAINLVPPEPSRRPAHPVPRGRPRRRRLPRPPGRGQDRPAPGRASRLPGHHYLGGLSRRGRGREVVVRGTAWATATCPLSPSPPGPQGRGHPGRAGSYEGRQVRQGRRLAAVAPREEGRVRHGRAAHHRPHPVHPGARRQVLPLWPSGSGPVRPGGDSPVPHAREAAPRSRHRPRPGPLGHAADPSLRSWPSITRVSSPPSRGRGRPRWKQCSPTNGATGASCAGYCARPKGPTPSSCGARAGSPPATSRRWRRC